VPFEIDQIIFNVCPPNFQISSRELRNDDERTLKTNRLKDRFDEKKHEILSRKSECTAMAGDSEQYSRKVKEIETW
jgi:hypothetical protein